MERYPIHTFRPVSLTMFFGLSCLLMFVFALDPFGVFRLLSRNEFDKLSPYLFTWSPSIAAAIVIGLTTGWPGVKSWLRGWTRWRVGVVWYLVALSPLLLFCTAMGLTTIFGGKLNHNTHTLSASLVPTLLLYVLTGPLGEEGGWRGYAQPVLQSRFPFPVASIIVGAMWAAWHIPAFFTREYVPTDAPYWMFALFLISCAIIMAWAVNGSGGSYVVAGLFHLSINISSLIVPCVCHVFPGSTFPFATIYFALCFTYASIVLVLLHTKSARAGIGRDHR